MTEQTGYYDDHKARIYYITLALFAGFLFLFGLGNHHLKGSDENRVAGIATGMSISGDLVVPRLNGEPFLEKPPLYFWIASACFNLFRISSLGFSESMYEEEILRALLGGRLICRFKGVSRCSLFPLSWRHKQQMIFPCSMYSIIFP